MVGEPWTGLYTDVGEAMFEPSVRIWSHRVAVEPVWRTQAHAGKDRTGCLRGSPRVCGLRLQQQERPPDLGSLRAARGQILAAASQRGLRDVRVFGSVARGEAIETSDVDLW